MVVVPEEGDRVEECLASVRGQTHPLLDVWCARSAPRAVTCRTTRASGPSLPSARRTPRCGQAWPRPPAGTSCSCGVRPAAAACRGRPHRCPGRERRRPRDGGPGAGGRGRALAYPGPGGRAQRPPFAVAHPLELAGDLTLANKAFTRELAGRLELSADDDWGARRRSPPSFPRLAVDVLDRPVARLAHDRGHRAFGSRPSPLPELETGWTSTDWSRMPSPARASRPAGAGTGTTSLLPRFVSDAERADDETWSRLVGSERRARRHVEVRASSRSLLTLAAADRRGDVESLAAELESLGDDVRTELADGRPVAVWRSVELPAVQRRLAESETRLAVRVVRAREPRTHGRIVDLWARRRHRPGRHRS